MNQASLIENRRERALSDAEGFIGFALRCRRFGLRDAEYYASQAAYYAERALRAAESRVIGRHLLEG